MMVIALTWKVSESANTRLRIDTDFFLQIMPF